jgi:hypothetical protein
LEGVFCTEAGFLTGLFLFFTHKTFFVFVAKRPSHLLLTKKNLRMSTNPIFQFASPEVLSKLATIRPYVILILTKGENYGLSDTPRIIQSEHLPYVFQQREEYHGIDHACDGQ